MRFHNGQTYMQLVSTANKIFRKLVKGGKNMSQGKKELVAPLIEDLLYVVMQEGNLRKAGAPNHEDVGGQISTQVERMLRQLNGKKKI